MLRRNRATGYARRVRAPTASDKPEPSRLERAGELAARASSLQPSDPNVRRALQAGIGIMVVLGVGFAVVAAIGDFPDVTWRFRPAALLLATFGLGIFLVANAEIWRRLLHSLGPELRPIRAQAIWTASALGRYVPTAALTPVLRMALSERLGAPKRITLASLVYETALVLTASVVIGAYFVITLPDLTGQWQRYLVLAIPLIALIALQPRIFHRVADYALQRLGRATLPLSLGEWRILEFIGMYLISMVVAGLSLYALAQSFYPVDVGDLPTVIGAFSVATVFSFLAFLLPGGLGAREAAMTLALSPIMPAGPALAIAVLSRILQLALEVAIALTSPVLARRQEVSRPR
jgi:hypothetical protein